jgi:hypothetical protein
MSESLFCEKCGQEIGPGEQTKKATKRKDTNVTAQGDEVQTWLEGTPSVFHARHAPDPRDPRWKIVE